MLVEQKNQSQERVQAVRPVYTTGTLPATNALPDTEILSVAIYLDPSGREIVIWEDVLFAYKDAVNIRQGCYVLPFLRGTDYMLIEPRCIAAVPDAVLDVYIEESSEKQDAILTAALAALQVALQAVSQQSSSQSMTQLVSLTEETVQGLSRNMACGFAKEFESIYNSPSIPARASNNCNSSVKVQLPGDIPQRQEQQAATETLTLWHVDALTKSWPPGAINPVSASLYIANVHTKSDDSSFEHPCNNDQDNIKVPAAIPFEQEQSFLTESDIKAMSAYTADIVAKAKQGNAESQYELAQTYRKGYDGFSCSDETAIEWYLKAANQGHIKAQMEMAGYYDEGFSIPKDLTKVFEWYMKAAIQGERNAQYNIATIYERGQGVPADKLMAIEWYLKAANAGCFRSRRYINCVHIKGNWKFHVA
ncbi:hypothetical protein BGZ47_006133 [Haplosporangium gracile]|nr:hypothetical protein BGZ47_006133 [Haplosporangium gracile]